MPKNILFVVDNLIMGGVTKVMENLLERLDSNKYNIDILVLHYYQDMKIKIPKNIEIISGNKYFSSIDKSIKQILKEKDFKAFIKKLKLVILLKTGLIKKDILKFRKQSLQKEYDTEIAFSDGFSHIFVANGDSKNKIAWMHLDVSVQNDSKRYYNLVKESLHKMDMCVCVSDKVKQAYAEYYGLDKIQTIHNVMNVSKIKEDSEKSFENPFKEDVCNLISVGRLDYQKNYSRFINVHKKLIEEGYKINSFLIGDGIEKEELQDLVNKNNISDTFCFLGRKDNPFPFVKNADLFVLSSRYEGLPTVLYESIILKTPCVTTEVAGAKEILEDKYGKITENSDEGLYNGIKEMLDSPQLLQEYKRNLENYEYDNINIIKKIESIL